MDIYTSTLESILNQKHTFQKSYKCLTVNRPISAKTIKKHIEILVSSINKIRALILAYEANFSQENKSQVQKIFTELIDKLKFVLDKFEISQDLPETYTTKVTVNLDGLSETSQSSEPSQSSDSDSDSTTGKMAQTVAQFLNNASKILPEFDGKAENLQSFIDAISLLELIKDSHEAVAVNLVKTKLKGTARNLITNETTLQQIISKLKASVKGESVEVLTAKILNIKQQGKAANAYTKEIEDLTKSLENAYITDGISPELSIKYSTQTAVKAMAKNCTSDRVKLIMEAGNFSDMNEAVSKFVASCTEASGQQNSILFYKRNNNYRRGSNYNNRGHYRGRGGYNNRRPNYNNNSNQQQYNQNRNSNKSNRGYNNANSSNRNVRLVASNSIPENDSQPLRQ